MSAWTKLLAASSLAIGSAWQLISSPRTGGSGVVVNNGVQVADIRITTTVADNRLNIALAPGFAVQITTTPIGATA